MSIDYYDAVDDARLNAAARRVLALSLTACPVPVRELATRVVTATFCSCVTNAEDACEGRLSAIYAALISEVVRRVEALVTGLAPSTATPDAADMAPDQSFPASDSPAWIWRPGSARRDEGIG